jgi:hypothetical protein
VDDRLADGRVLLEDGLDLRGGDVLAAGDDRVGLAPDDRQRAVGPPGAEIAGAQLAARRRASPVGPLTSTSPSPASRTRVQKSGTPFVVTCEHASVRP